jgi:hypothetical protein
MRDDRHPGRARTARGGEHLERADYLRAGSVDVHAVADTVDSD